MARPMAETTPAEWVETGGGGGGGSGGSPSIIYGEATGIAQADIPVFSWSFDQRMQFADGTSPITYTVTGSIAGRRVSMSAYSVQALSDELSVTPDPLSSTNIRTGKITSTNSATSKMAVYYGERELGRSTNEIAFGKVDLIVPQGPGTNGGTPLPEDRQPAGGTAPEPNELDPGTIVLLFSQDQTNRVATTLTLKADPTGGSVTLDQHGLTDLKIYTDEALQDELTMPKTWTNGETSPTTLYMVGSSTSTILQSAQGTLDLTYKANLAANGGEYSIKDTVGVNLAPAEIVIKATETSDSSRFSYKRLKLVDWGGGRSALLDATIRGTKEQNEPKWDGWSNASAFEGMESSDWYDIKRTSEISEVFTAKAVASAKKGSVEIELFNGQITYDYKVDATAAGADAFPDMVKDLAPEWMSKWKAGATGQVSWRYAEYFQNGEKIGIQTFGQIKNLSIGYDSVSFSTTPLAVPALPGVTIIANVDLSAMEAKLTGAIIYDESKMHPWVAATGNLSGESNIKISATGKAGPLKVTGGGSGNVKVWGQTSVKDGKFAMASVGLDIEQVKTFVQVEVVTPIGDKTLVDVPSDWPNAEIHKRKDFPPQDIPSAPPPIFNPTNSYEIDRSKL